jgi:Xylanase inhibitor N-terminal
MGHPLFSLTSTTLTKRLAMDTHVKLWQAATARAAAVSSADSPSMSPAKGEAKRGRAAAATGATAAAAEPKLLSIPLIPHAVHKRRRLLEIMSSSPEWATTSTASATLFSNATTASDALGREELLESMLLGHDAQHLARPRRYPLERQRNRRRRLNTATLSVDQGDGSSENQQSEPQQSAHTQSTTTGTKPNQVLSLYQGFGTHYADIWVGSPPQRQTLIVDTGSATTAFACSGCSPRRCGRLDRYHTDPLFDERKSSTFRKIGCSECFLGECVDTEHGVADQCDFGVAYQEGSNWTAFEAVDRCYVGGWHNKAVSSRDGTTVQNVSSNAALSPLSLSNHDGSDPHRAALDYSFDLRFGCQTQMTGPFRTQLADGIMGMDIGKPAIWNQMYLQNAIATRAFSLCFSRQTDARRSGTQAGALTFGGTDVRLHAHNHVMVYSATNFDGAGFFSVQLHQIYLRHSSGGESVVSSSSSSLDNTQQALVIPLNVAENLMNHGEIIIDSGTTDTYFVHQYVL